MGKLQSKYFNEIEKLFQSKDFKQELAQAPAFLYQKDYRLIEKKL